MKKPIIVIISLIYILAIVVVGFLGMAIKVFKPTTFVNDIQVKFDTKLTKNPKTSEGTDYAYRILGDTQVTFNVTANVLPNEASQKECIFEKRDEESCYTMETNFTGEYTIATFTCDPASSGESYLIKIKVKPTDGNKQLFKMIDIYVYNW